MKKLIIVAAAAAMGISAFGACSYIPPTPSKVGDPAWAYKWKFSGKTTKAVEVKCSRQAGTFVTRTSTSLKIQGWSFYCDPICGDFEAAQADEIFWSTKPEKVLFDEARAGDALAKEILDEAFAILGETIADACCMVDPELVVLGGGVSKAGQDLIDGVWPYFEKFRFHASKGTRFALATLGNDAGIHGCFHLIAD